MAEHEAAYSDFLVFWIVWGAIIMLGVIWLFRWSIRTGQYSEERRAGMLPLDDVDLEAPKHMTGGGGHLAFILAITAVGLFVIALAGYLAMNAPPDTP